MHWRDRYANLVEREVTLTQREIVDAVEAKYPEIPSPPGRSLELSGVSVNEDTGTFTLLYKWKEPCDG